MGERTATSDFGCRDGLLESWGGDGEGAADIPFGAFPFLVGGAVSILEINERLEIILGIKFLFFGL